MLSQLQHLLSSVRKGQSQDRNCTCCKFPITFSCNGFCQFCGTVKQHPRRSCKMMTLMYNNAEDSLSLKHANPLSLPPHLMSSALHLRFFWALASVWRIVHELSCLDRTPLVSLDPDAECEKCRTKHKRLQT